MRWREIAVTAAELDELFGTKCPACGWRGGPHRPYGAWLTPCPSWDPLVWPDMSRPTAQPHIVLLGAGAQP